MTHKPWLIIPTWLREGSLEFHATFSVLLSIIPLAGIVVTKEAVAPMLLRQFKAVKVLNWRALITSETSMSFGWCLNYSSSIVISSCVMFWASVNEG